MPRLKEVLGNHPRVIDYLPKTTRMENLEPYLWKKGQSGNPAGRPIGSRHKYAEEFMRDFYEMWQQFGKAALETTAMEYPAEYIRAAVALVPKEFHATVAKININRLSDVELDALIEREIRTVTDQETAPEDQTVL